MSYREFAVPPSLRGPVACTWTHRTADTQLVVPDGCVDLIWLAGRELIMAGPDTRPHLEGLPADSVTSGVRLRPGVAESFLGRPANEVVDGRIDASELWCRWPAELTDTLSDASPDEARRQLLHTVQAQRVHVDPLVARASTLLSGPHRRVADIADELGVTERRLHRRCRAAVGYGPKFLARVLRLRRLTRTPGRPIDRALAAGYASQAHMNDDVRLLTGRTAVRFLEDHGGQRT